MTAGTSHAFPHAVVCDVAHLEQVPDAAQEPMPDLILGRVRINLDVLAELGVLRLYSTNRAMTYEDSAQRKKVPKMMDQLSQPWFSSLIRIASISRADRVTKAG